MTNDLPPKGAVIPYPYLWAREFEKGEAQGRKSRPVCLVLKVRDKRENIHHLLLLAITS